MTRLDSPAMRITVGLLVWYMFGICAVSPIAAQGSQRYRQLVSEIDEQALKETVYDLSSMGSRVVGYPGERQAAEYVRQRFLRLGLDKVEEQLFPVTVPVDKGASLDIPALGRHYRLHPLYPNLVRTSQTPPDGLKGPLIYAGRGRLHQFNGKNVDGSIALMEFGGGSDWFNAVFLGARAVIFIEPERLLRGEAETKFLTTPIDIPRFWISKKDAEELRSLMGKTLVGRGAADVAGKKLDVVLRCRMEWEQVTAKNISGWIWGTDPERKNEIVAITAYYDSMSVVPSLAPGAEQACSIAALLEIAKVLKSRPLDRTVLLVATSGHCFGVQGAANFVENWLDRENDSYKSGKTAEDRLLSLVAIDLSSGNDQFGVFYQSHLFEHRDSGDRHHFADIGKLCRESAARVGFAFGFEPDSRFVDGINPIKGKDWRTYLPGMLALESGPMALSGKAGFGFVTVDDARNVVDTPFDTFAAVNFSNLMTQVPILACILYDLLGAPAAALEVETEDHLATLSGHLLEWDPQESRTAIPDRPVEGSIAVVRDGRIPNKTMMGVRTVVYDLTDKGSIEAKETPIGSIVVLMMLVTVALLWVGWGVGRTAEHKIVWLIGTVLITGVIDYLIFIGASRVLATKIGAEVREVQGGSFRFVGLSTAGNAPSVRVEGYKLDTDTGGIIYAPDRGRHGAEVTPMDVPMDINDKNTKVALFRCKPMALFDMIDQRRFTLLQEIYLYDAVTGGEPFKYGYSLPVVPPMSSFYEPCAVVYAPEDTRVKVTMGASLLGLSFVLMGNDPLFLDHPDWLFNKGVMYACPEKGCDVTQLEAGICRRHGTQFVESEIGNYDSEDDIGRGFLIDDYRSIPVTPYRVAQDMWILDHFRMERLREKGVKNQRADAMHSLAKKHLDEAERNRKELLYDQFLTNARQAWSYESKAYPDVRKTAMDVVKGIIFYLFLMLPFAFFAERLFFYATDVRKQIVLTSIIFLSIFFVIRWFHPAFEIITATPIIILLAFVIIALSIIVTFIIVQKFEAQMRQIKFETSGVHTADMGRFSATTAAFNLGISNMRRRKARTYLTATTLILLTFTVISFTSVTPTVRLNRIEIKEKDESGNALPAPYTGALIRQRSWEPLGEPTTRVLRDEYGGRYAVAPRAWYFSTKAGTQSYVTVGHHDVSYAATALVGMSVEEKKVTAALDPEDPDSCIIGRWFNSEHELACLIPTRMARAFGIRPEDVIAGLEDPDRVPHVNALGLKLPVIGIIDSQKLNNITDLDFESLTPVDYMLSEQGSEREGAQATTAQREEYIHLSPDAIMFLPYELIMQMGGNLRSIAIRFGWQTDEQADEGLRTLMDRFELNLFGGVPNGKVFLLSATGATGFKGMESVFIPLLIAAMIVLSTMLGSVYERVREIGIYTSLGLAPLHIGAIFLAESSVYAVLGAIMGYLVGQGFAKAKVTWGIFEALNLNYSSTAAWGVTLVIMLVVLASTIYPAWKASQVSVPGIERRWRLPDPEGDYLQIVLPFTVSSGQTLGVMSFLKEYLEAHADSSVGQFSAENVHMGANETEYGKRYQIEAMVWVAPYDLGVSEHFRIETKPSEDVFVNTVHITIRRESGDDSSWLSVTRNYLNMIRKQFLIWRTFPPEVKDRYAIMGREALGLPDEPLQV